MREHLPDEVLAHVGLRSRPRDHQTGRRGDNQRGNLRDEAVADGQNGVGVQSIRERQPLLRHTDHEPAQDVHRGDDQTGHGVATNEFAGAVHCPVEVGFAGDGLPAPPRLLLVDQTGVQVRVDGHLLARHGVQRETGRHLGHATSTLGDHDKLNHHQDQENDDPYDVIPLDDKGTEGADHLPRVALAQDQARTGHVQRQPEQRGHEQQPGENGKLQRLRDVHRDQEHEQRK